MKQALNADYFANTVRMTRTKHKGTILILEGYTDSRVFKWFVHETECKVISVNGKDNAIEILKILEDDGVEGILTIMDADFWHLEGIEPGSGNLLLTDTHDLETMILSSSEVMDKILSGFVASKKEKLLPRPIIDLVLENTLPVGFLRWMTQSSAVTLKIKFRKLAFEHFIDKKNLNIDIDKLIEEVKANLKDGEIDEGAVKDIKAKISALKKEGHDPWQVCSGHDIVKVLAIGLRFVFGNKKSKNLTAEILEEFVRNTYNYSHFQLSHLYRSIVNWETSNPSFNVLRLH